MREKKAVAEAGATPVRGDDWLDRVQPLIRIRTYRPLTFFPRMHEIVGLSRNEMVVVRKPANVPIPERIYDPGGQESLRELGQTRGRVFTAHLAQVKRATSEPRSVLRRCDTFRVLGGNQALSCRIRQDDSVNIDHALRLLLGDRFHQKKDLYLRSIFWRLTPFFGCVAAAIIAGTYLDESPTRDRWIFAAGVLAFVFLIVGVLDSSPVRIKVVDSKPRKDLSDRRPLRLRIAGTLMTIVGSLFIAYCLIFQFALGAAGIGAFNGFLDVEMLFVGELSDVSPDQAKALRYGAILMFAGMIEILFFLANFTFMARAALAVTVLFFLNVLALSITLVQSFRGETSEFYGALWARLMPILNRLPCPDFPEFSAPNSAPKPTF
jgi:hypothetical protein